MDGKIAGRANVVADTSDSRVDSDLGQPSRLSSRAFVALLLFGAFSVAVFLFRVAGSQEETRIRPFASVLGSIAFAALYLIPAVLIVMSRHRRPGLLAVAGVIGIALIPTSMSITPLLLIPSVLVLTVRRRSEDAAFVRSSVPTALVAVAAAMLTLGGIVSFIALSEPACWSYTISEDGTKTYTTEPVVGGGMHMSSSGGTGGGGGCTSSAPTLPAALSSIGLFAAAISASWSFSKPKTPRAGRAQPAFSPEMHP